MFLENLPVRLRLWLGHSFVMACIYITIGLGLYKTIEHNLTQSVNMALTASAHSLRNARYSAKSKSLFKAPVLEQIFKTPLQIQQIVGERYIRPYAQIIGVSGEIYSKSKNVETKLPMTHKSTQRAEKGLSTLETFILPDNRPMRQVTLPVMEEGKFTGDVIQVAASYRNVLDTLKSTAFILWLIIPSTLLISIILGYFLTGRALRPVRLMTHAAAKMGVDDLGVRLNKPKSKDEIRDLAETFNSLLARLEDAVKRLRRFTGDVSHELRTPLAVLRGEADLALRRERTCDEYKKSLRIISGEAKHMTVIIEDLLLLARVESKSVALNWIPMLVSDFVEELKNRVQSIYQAKQVSLVTNIAGVSNFYCSQTYLCLALCNILLNAAKHSKPGSQVKLTVKKEDSFLLFQISDEGEGISKEALPNIFDPFYRVDTARNRASGGVGIGLSLALALVKLHGGKISVFSSLGSGTCFKSSIPLKLA